MDPDTVLYKRIVYTFWEFFGEIGGFLEILTIFGGILVSIGNIISGSDLDGYLMSQLFFFAKENKNGRERARFNHHNCFYRQGSKL